MCTNYHGKEGCGEVRGYLLLVLLLAGLPVGERVAVLRRRGGNGATATLNLRAGRVDCGVLEVHVARCLIDTELGRRDDRRRAGRVGCGALDVHVLGGDRREEQGAEEDRQLHCVPACARPQGKGSISARKPWRKGREGVRVVPAQDGPRVRETAALVRAWRRAAAAWLCAAEEVHGMLGRVVGWLREH